MVYIVNEGGSEHFRRILMGILACCGALKRPWQVRWGSWDGGLAMKEADGLILPLRDAARARQVRATGRPVINVSTFGEEMGIPSVVPDNTAIGRLAGEFFARRLHPAFAFLGAVQQRDNPCLWDLRGPSWTAEIELEVEELRVSWHQQGRTVARHFPYGLSRADAEAAILAGP